MKKMAPLFNVSSDVDQSPITRRDLLRFFFKHKAIIIASFLVVSSLVAVGLIFLPPVYMTTAKVRIKNEQQINPAFFTGVAAYREKEINEAENRLLETEMELVELHSIAEEVVRDLNITYDQVYHKPYVILLRPVGDFYDLIREKVFSFSPDLEKRGVGDTTKELVKSIIAEPLKSKSADTNSNLIQITLRSPNAETGKKALQRWLEIYTAHERRLNEKAGEKAHEIVKEMSAEWEKKVLDAQEELRKFLANNTSLARSRSTLNSPNISVANAKPATSQKPLGSAPMDNNQGTQATVDHLKTRILDLDLRLAELQRVFTRDHEMVKKVLENIRETKQKLEAELQSTAASETTSMSLERNLLVAETIYMELAKRLSQIEAFLKINQYHEGNRSIVEQPLRARTSEWKKTLLVGIAGAFAGLLLGILLASIRQYFDHTFQSQEEIKRHLSLPVIACLPKTPDADVDLNVTSSWSLRPPRQDLRL